MAHDYNSYGAHQGLHGELAGPVCHTRQAHYNGAANHSITHGRMRQRPVPLI